MLWVVGSSCVLPLAICKLQSSTEPTFLQSSGGTVGTAC